MLKLKLKDLRDFNMTPTQKEVQTVLRFLFEKNIINASEHNRLAVASTPYTSRAIHSNVLPLLDPRVKKMMKERRKNRL